jgi:pimeloyl-ACP methyl ester carboxylesterase
MAEQAAVEGREHWTTKGEVKLFLWEKQAVTPEKRGTVLFVHGSSMASQPTFDLTVPGRPDSSVMDWFARRGFDTWSVDMEGYGRSDKHRDINCDIANGADDLAAASSYIMETSAPSACPSSAPGTAARWTAPSCIRSSTATIPARPRTR